VASAPAATCRASWARGALGVHASGRMPAENGTNQEHSAKFRPRNGQSLRPIALERQELARRPPSAVQQRRHRLDTVPRCRREVARADLEAVTGLVAKLAVVGTVRRERPGMLDVAATEPEPLVVPLVKLTAAPAPALDFEAAFRTSARPGHDPGSTSSSTTRPSRRPSCSAASAGPPTSTEEPPVPPPDRAPGDPRRGVGREEWRVDRPAAARRLSTGSGGAAIAFSPDARIIQVLFR
jgi:hypothetical protein